MINNLVIFLFFSAFSFTAFACEVKLPQHIVILGASPNLNKDIKHTGCDDEALKRVTETMLSVEGKITSFQLVAMLKEKNLNINIQPRLIEVQHLRHLVREQLLLPSGVQVKATEAVNAPNYLVVESGDKVEVHCTGCLFGSQQPLNISVVGFDGSTRSIIVKADFKKMVKAYRVVGFHPAFSNITSQSLKEVYIESIPHTDLITELETLHFFKLNKPIRNGALLKKSDLNALDLVKAGLTTEVIIENKLVRLKTSGISRSNGSLGQFVEVFHPQKKKKYQGRVVDINKVLVEL